MTCPAWCSETHAGVPLEVHRAELRGVVLALDGVTLFLDLVQSGDEAPLILMRVDERPVAQLMPGEATRAALDLLGLVDEVRRGPS